MPTQYTQEQLDKLYEKLPEELREAMFSMETAEEIGEICESYGINDNRVGEIADRVGYILAGLMLPQEFAAVLEKEVKLPKVLAEAISKDLNRFVFYPVRPALEQLHRMEIEVSAKIVTPQPVPETEEQTPEKPKQSEPDTYREPIE